MQIGPLALKSTLSLNNFGVDSNVFNEADAEHPQSDYTVTFTPITDAWLRMGRTWLSGSIKVDWVYYTRFASERSANSTYKLGWLVPFNRLTLKAGVSDLNTRERPGYEIDARSRRKELVYEGSAEIRAFFRTYVGVKTQSRKTEFDQNAVFLGTSLAEVLNRTTTARAVTIRHQLTPLTGFSLDVGRDQERFEFSSLRDSNSTRIAGGVTLDPRALLSGSATFGYRQFTPLSAAVPAFKGGIAALSLSYTAWGTTKLGVQVNRDLQYSFEIEQPYYLQTGLTAFAQRQVAGPVDLVARVGTQRLAYRDLIGAVVEVSNRTDHLRTYGGGLGYRLGRDTRVEFNVDRQRRLSEIDAREYNNLRYGFGVKYGT